MYWTTTLGDRVEHDFSVAGKPLSKWTERDKYWVSKYSIIERICIRLDSEIIMLKNENTRLTHENEFMLKLINANMKDE